MSRFLAIAVHDCDGNEPRLRDLADREELTITAIPGWIVLSADLPVVPLADNMLLLGCAFDRTTSQPLVDGRQGIATASWLSGIAESLTAHIWGSYAVIGTTRMGQAFTFRDPMGGLPVYHRTWGGTVQIASGLDLLFAQEPAPPEVDWSALAEFFRDGQPASPATAITDVRELTPGATLARGDGVWEESCHWNPVTFAAQAGVTDAGEAADYLRETISATVSAWARCWKRPLVELSGGVDSSIVAAVTAKSAPSTVAATLVTPGRDGNERRLAKTVTDHLNISLFEGVRDIARIDLTRAIAPHLPRHGVRGFTQESDRLIDQMASDAGADVLFNGGGGDGLFCKLDSADPFADLSRRRPGFRALLRTAIDTADAAHADIWSVMQAAYRGSSAGASGRERRARLVPYRGRSASPIASPLLHGVENLPPGRRSHIEDVVGVGPHRFGMARANRRPMVFPLMSQPIVEACLAIPSWLWVAGGRDRAIAREAFRDRLPASVIFRRSKGRLDRFGYQLYAYHRPIIRDMLLDGALAAQGIIDRKEVERQLSSTEPVRGGGYFLLLELADIEAWVQGVRSRSWAFSRSQRAY